MRISNSLEFGKLVRTTRKQAKLTQFDLAAACGVGERFIRELEKGKSSCQLGKALLVAKMLGIHLEARPPRVEDEQTIL
jgi:y4mF family transcriptional regulator